MVKQLNIRSDEAFETARRLANELGRSQTDVVVEALRQYSERILPSNHILKEKALADLKTLRRMVRDANQDKPADLSSDHSFLYDEWGLPK